MKQTIGVHELGKDEKETHLTDEPTKQSHGTGNHGGRTEGPRAGCELRDNSPGPVTIAV